MSAIIIHECCRDRVSTGNPITKGGVKFHLCMKHGHVELVPFYKKAETEITKETILRLYHACLFCIEERMGTVMEADTDFCKEAGCHTRNNLMDCHLCGDTVCIKHSLGEVCLDCAEEASKETLH